MVFNLFVLLTTIFVPMLAESEQKGISKTNEISLVEKKKDEIKQEKKIDTKKIQKKKIKFINNITKNMLGYKYGSTFYPNNFKLGIGNEIFTEFKKETDASEVNNIIAQKEIIIENNVIEIWHEYTWQLSMYNGLKKQRFVLKDVDKIESIGIEFDWKQQTPHNEHIVLKIKYKNSDTTSCCAKPETKSVRKDKTTLLAKKND